jgi:hypothetical protein
LEYIRNQSEQLNAQQKKLEKDQNEKRSNMAKIEQVFRAAQQKAVEAASKGGARV